MDEFILNGEDVELNEDDDVCARAYKIQFKTKLEQIDEKYMENLRDIIKLDAKIAEMSNGNAKYRNDVCNDLYLISLSCIWWKRKEKSQQGQGGYLIVERWQKLPELHVLGQLHLAQYTSYRD